ncbi:MAG: hypothetical protein AAF443_06430 [Chlamydiota bacterium]
MIFLLKKIFVLASKEGKNPHGIFAAHWKRRIAAAFAKTIIRHSHFAFRKFLTAPETPRRISSNDADMDWVTGI